MAEYFRCGARIEACARARKGQVCSGANWTCPANNLHCLELRQPVPIMAYYARELRWVLIALGSALVLLLLFLLLRSDPLKAELQGCAAQARQLDGRLVELRARPTESRQELNPLASLNGLNTRARELAERVRQQAEGGDAAAARPSLGQLADMVKQAEALRQTGDQPGNQSGAVAIAARHAVEECDNLAAQIDSLRQRAGGNSAFAAQCETLDGSVQDMTAGFRKLIKGRGGHPPDPTELTRLVASIKTNYSEAADALANVAPKVIAPFADQDATLIVCCTSDLAGTLVLPELQAQAEGHLVSPAAGQWYYTTGSGGPGSQRVVVRQAGSVPLAALFRQGTDLVVTEHEPDVAERTAFAREFPGTDLDSRASAEVVAMDALTFLVQPNSSAPSVDAESARQRSDWLGGAPGSAERAAADRWGFTVGRNVAGPVADAILASPGGIGLGAYHLEGSTIKARQLPCRSGATALQPSPFTIATEDYKFAHRIVAYQNPRARAAGTGFVRFLTSDKGQQIVASCGYVDLRLRPANGDADPVRLSAIAGALHLKTVRSANRLSTDLRFRTGVDHLDLSHAESALDLKAQADLVRLPIELARDYARAKVVILGFTDNTGLAGTNQPLSVRRADSVAGQLKLSGVDAKTAGLSDQLPVDTNATEEGRARNRRCEIWVVTE